MTIRRKTEILPTISCSSSTSFADLFFQDFFLRQVQMSIVNIVEAELNTEVKEDIRAAIITANIEPLKPGAKQKHL